MEQTKNENVQVGFGTCVEFATEDGDYVATWSKEKSQITLAMPGGATLCSTGNTVTYNPFSTLKKSSDPIQTENSNDENTAIQKEDFTDIKNISNEIMATPKEDFINIENSNNEIKATLNEDFTKIQDSNNEIEAIQNECFTKIEDSNNESEIIHPLNTHGAYEFDVVNIHSCRF